MQWLLQLCGARLSCWNSCGRGQHSATLAFGAAVSGAAALPTEHSNIRFVWGPRSRAGCCKIDLYRSTCDAGAVTCPTGSGTLASRHIAVSEICPCRHLWWPLSGSVRRCLVSHRHAQCCCLLFYTPPTRRSLLETRIVHLPQIWNPETSVPSSKIPSRQICRWITSRITSRIYRDECCRRRRATALGNDYRSPQLIAGGCCVHMLPLVRTRWTNSDRASLIEHAA